MRNKILHKGVVDEIGTDCVRVRIVQQEACGACQIAGHCQASRQKQKVVDVWGAPTEGLAVGREVTVAATAGMGMGAVGLAFVLPFVLMTAVIFIASRFTTDEALMALFGLASLIPYYIILYMLRSRVSRQIRFELLIN